LSAGFSVGLIYAIYYRYANCYVNASIAVSYTVHLLTETVRKILRRSLIKEKADAVYHFKRFDFLVENTNFQTMLQPSKIKTSWLGCTLANGVSNDTNCLFLTVYQQRLAWCTIKLLIVYYYYHHHHHYYYYYYYNILLAIRSSPYFSPISSSSTFTTVLRKAAPAPHSRPFQLHLHYDIVFTGFDVYYSTLAIYYSRVTYSTVTVISA